MATSSNPSEEDDLVTIFRSAEGGTAEMEVITVRQLLEANGIETMLVGDSPMPNFTEEIRVARADAARAEELIAQALAAGPAAAAEAEAQGEAEAKKQG